MKRAISMVKKRDFDYYLLTKYFHLVIFEIVHCYLFLQSQYQMINFF